LKDKKNLIKIILIIIGIIILVFLAIYIYNKYWNQPPCNCLPLNINNETTNQGAAAYTNITPADAKTMLDTDSSIALVDVRTADEYNQGHIPGCILMPLDQLPNSAESKLTNKDQKIIVYCRTGGRSSAAADVLVGLGYTNVCNMLGGISNWTYDIEK